MRAMLAVATAIAATSAASLASADTYVVRERPEGVRVDEYRYSRGAELGGYAGVGYGVGAGARVGGTVDPGVYLGGAFTYYSGNAAFVGGEVGYKIWPGYRWELRPYLFMGPAFVRVGDEGFGRRPDQPDVVFAFQPGFLAAYHLGAVYLAADGRAYVTPNPGALALLGGVGVNL
jgi:hypothetical protein